MNDNGAMLNAYPDSMGGTLKEITDLLSKPELKEAFESFYILPSLFNTDLDRGFSVIDYTLNKELASKDDIERIKSLGINLKLDFILNHASVLSKQFQDILAKGEESQYKDFFINWNKFWQGKGTMTEEGYIQPDAELIKNMFFRKPGLPLLMVPYPDGTLVPYWNTFYQEVKYPVLDPQNIMAITGLQYYSAQKLADLLNPQLQSKTAPYKLDYGKYEEYKEAVNKYLYKNSRYLGQMDLNIKSPLVWDFYNDTLQQLKDYGAKIVRLDAFAYAPKEPGLKNFLNEPGTWELLQKVDDLAKAKGLNLLPEIHASYGEHIYKTIADKGYMTYDFFLPGLIIDAFETKSGATLNKWATELIENNIRTVNMLGCHDGIPLLDLKGLISDQQIQNLIDTVVARGGYVKNLHGQKNMYYQVNATFYSALGEDDQKMLLARAIQLFMPGKPQIWYLDLFAGKNDHEAVKRAGEGGHKEINRTNLSVEQINEMLTKEVVKKQLELLQFRNTHKAFSFDSAITTSASDNTMTIRWQKDNNYAELNVNFADYSYTIKHS